jgi:tetratricopeptide (TPR) repeat protein
MAAKQMSQRLRPITLSLLLIAATGCSGIRPVVVVDEPAAPAEAAKEIPPTASDKPDTSNATLALLQQSERAATGGAITEAIAYLERAIRIEPRHAGLWLQLAALEVANQQYQTAVAYANKALTLAGNHTDWQRDAWLIIADAKAAQGDLEGAAAIRQRWRG